MRIKQINEKTYDSLQEKFSALKKLNFKALSSTENLVLKAVRTRFVPVDRVPLTERVRPRYSFRRVHPQTKDPKGGWKSVNFKTHNPFDDVALEFADSIESDDVVDPSSTCELKVVLGTRKRTDTGSTLGSNLSATSSKHQTKKSKGPRGRKKKLSHEKITGNRAAKLADTKKKLSGNTAKFQKSVANVAFSPKVTGDKPVRNYSTYSKCMKSLAKFGFQTWPIGVLETKLKGQEGDILELKENILFNIQNITIAFNNLKRLSQLAAKFLIDHLIKSIDHVHLLQGKYYL